MSQLQKYWTNQCVQLGSLAKALEQAENVLQLYLPPSTWKGHNGVRFISSLGSDNGTHLRVRKDFFSALGIDLKVKLKYKPDTFVSMLLSLCKKKKWDFDTLVGSSWINAPLEGNYVLGILLILLFTRATPAFLCDAVMETMRVVDTVEYEKNSLSAPVEVNSALEVHFNKYAVNKELAMKPGSTFVDQFSDRYHKQMTTVIETAQVNKAARNMLKNRKYVRDGVKARHVNQMGREMAEMLGINEELDNAEEEMRNENQTDLFGDSDEEVGFDDDDIRIEEDGNDVKFSVNVNATRDLVKKLNTMDLKEMLNLAKKSIRLADNRDKITAKITMIQKAEELQNQIRVQELEAEAQRLRMG